MFILDYPTAMRYLIYCLAQNRPFLLDEQRCYYDIKNKNGKHQLRFRYPLCTPDFSTFSAAKWPVAARAYRSSAKSASDIPAGMLKLLLPNPPCYMLVLLQVGNAALATIENGQIMQHKVIAKYVTRKKQGKSQINYLKTKGKSRAGSRVRLANARLFFDEVNDWLVENLNNNTRTVLYSATPLILGMLFSSKHKSPLDKDDPRLRKIPLDVNRPRFAQLQYVRKKTEEGWIEYGNDADDMYRKELQSLWDGRLISD